MNTIFVAVAILMVLLIGFVVLVLRSLATSAGIRIRADMVRLLESYDHVIDVKSKQVGRLQEEVEVLRQRRGAMAAPPEALTQEGGMMTGQAAVPSAAHYRPKTFGGGYGSIRDCFHLEGTERGTIVGQVAESLEPRPLRGSAADRLRQALSFDTVFRLTQLPSDEQLEILDTALNDEGWALLRDFCQEQTENAFDASRFFDWLRDLSDLESDGLRVRCGDPMAGGEGQGMEYRPEICEGIQVVSGNRLYDYSIKEREIS